MTTYDIRIQSLADAHTGAPLFPEYLSAAEHPLRVVGVGIVEGGMQSGKVSMYLILETEHGLKCHVQLGGEAFLTIGAAIKGAMARFGQSWDGP